MSKKYNSYVDQYLEIQNLHKQLAEKDKEIERLKNLPRQWAEQDIELARITERTEICEKIREFVKDENLGNGFIEMSEIAFNKKLDQIEKGE